MTNVNKLVALAALAIFAFHPSTVLATGHGGSHSGSNSSTVHVSGHTTKNGTYVQPHYRTAPDHTKLNNWSTKGNTNPYTGKVGTKNPDGH
jgi:hypothetical protein